MLVDDTLIISVQYNHIISDLLLLEHYDIGSRQLYSSMDVLILV